MPGRSEEFRVLTRTVDTDAGPAFLIVGINLDDVTDPVRIVTRLLAVSVPLSCSCSPCSPGGSPDACCARSSRCAPRWPRSAAPTSAGRVPEPGTGDEIDRLARTMNETLDRLEDAVRRQQRFVADASHELRSPLTRIRTELEVDLPARAAPTGRHRAQRPRRDDRSLQRLVDDLLHLAAK